ncbi:MAG: glycine betaine ABC transporter substrate-binding protein [Planctomycetota bacterium]
MSKRTLFAAIALGVLLVVPLSNDVVGPRIGSKKFTESVILGELARALAESVNVAAVHQRELGGTRILFEALCAGEIDAYFEYTGTIEREILSDQEIADRAAMQAALASKGIQMSRPLGFNNSYGIGLAEARAAELGLETISQLTRHPELVFAFTSEFLDRGDGWPALRDAYGLPQKNVTGMDHDIAYRQLANGAVDAVDVYTTDADIAYWGLRVLADDRKHFPRYDAVLLYRADLEQREPEWVTALLRLEGSVSEPEMRALNAAVKIDRKTETAVATEYLQDQLGVVVAAAEDPLLVRVGKRTLEHLELVRLSFMAAVFVGLPLGILAARRRGLGQVILALTGVIQTVPALALLVVLIGPMAALGLQSVGTGSAAAICALFLYSLLPIVRNTCDGLRGVAPDLIESADALGLASRERLFLIELPLASRSILAGLKTAAILNIGFATLGALIGAGGYGQPILTGIRLDDYQLILEGAVPAAALALLAQGAFELLDRTLIPRGLRLQREA